MKITLLGTGSPTPDPKRAASGYLVEIGEEMICFDHGGGAHERFLQAGKRAVDLNTIFFSHLHSDHCLDYARLVLTRWDMGAGQVPELKVYGPPQMKNMNESLFGDGGAFEVDLHARTHAPGSLKLYQGRGGALPRLRPDPDFTPLTDQQVIETDNWKVTVRSVYHQPDVIEAYGFRLETDEGILAYSGDTGPCQGVDDLAKDADLLIHMCFYISGTFRRKGRASVCGHLEVADIAARANAKAVVASHFSPQFEPPGVFEKCIAEMSRVYSGRIIWGEDLMELSLHPPEAKEVG